MWFCGRRLGALRIRDRGHGALRVQQMVFAGAQPKLDQRPRIGHRFALPAVIGLIAAHGIFTGLVPRARGFSAQVVFADQGFLNRLGALRVDLLLAARTR